MPRVKKNDLALLLGRLSNTIAAPDDSIQSFTTEIILTVNALTSSDEFDLALLPQVFWCACACLSTTVEAEFEQVLKLFEAVLPHINFDDPAVTDALLADRPIEWVGSSSLQSALLPGLRSSVTLESTLKVLGHLTRFENGKIMDPTDGRLRDMYTMSLPWCLNAMASGDHSDDALLSLAENIGQLAKQEGRHSIHKIMTSFSRSHFRTKDDFLRQSVSSLREHYGADHWTEIVTLLMGLVLNRERWLRINTMQILKVLFQQRETRNPVELLGSELLMPLLRLLETDLAAEALDVLEEPMTMSGGLAAKHVLRMSMHGRMRPAAQDANSVATVFGVPEESGWCIVKADALREVCRANVMAVFGTCSLSSRPSQIEFEPEVEALAVKKTSRLLEEEEDLGGLVQNLHDLTTFFKDDDHADTQPPMALPSRRLEARVAAILAKSTASEVVTESDIPPTPFVDVFRVGAMSVSDEDSDYYSNSDSEHDAFIFDSPTVYRSAPNGSKLS